MGNPNNGMKEKNPFGANKSVVDKSVRSEPVEPRLSRESEMTGTGAVSPRAWFDRLATNGEK
jgi:hypothetical protein